MGALNAATSAPTARTPSSTVGAQSPAFWAYPPSKAMYEKPPATGIRIFLTQGSINDGDGGSQMKNRLDRGGYKYVYVLRNEGHAWAHWRATLTRMKRYFFKGARLNPPAKTYSDFCQWFRGYGKRVADRKGGPTPSLSSEIP
jgi:hypothetical protein